MSYLIMKSKTVLLFGMVYCFSSFFLADTPRERLLSALTTYYKNYPAEKVYVQTDKSVYLSSQTIWYKMYSTSYGAPSRMSKVAYLQLLDRKGNIVVTKKLFLSDGAAQGDIQIPDSLPSSTYELRGFTAWMLNFEELGLFHKNIVIKHFADTSAMSFSETAGPKHFRIHFFPEGGDLVEGLASNVAFKATDEYGLPAEVSGDLKDEAGDIISRIKTVHDGMGKFELRPEPSHGYIASIRFPDGSAQEILLPQAKPFGVIMQIAEHTKDDITLKIKYREKEKGQYQHLLLASFQNAGKVVVYPVELDPGLNLFEVHNKEFSTGILRLTLFDTGEIPLAERIVFIENEGFIPAELERNTVSFKPKSRSSFSVKLSNEYWKLDKTSLSVSVTDADRVADDTLFDNIMSSMLMSSELKGYVYNPGYYFRNSDKETQSALDLIMLTNGWRHFSWKQVLDNEPYRLTYPVEKSLFVAGQVLDYRKYDPKTKPTLKLIIHNQDNSEFLGEAEPDSDGRFLLNDYNASGLSEIYFQGATQKNQNKPIHVKLITSPLDSMSIAPFIFLPAKPSENEYIVPWDRDEASQIQGAHKVKLMKAVLVRRHLPTKTEILAKRYVSPTFEVSRYSDVDLVNTFYPNSLRLFDLLKGRFAGLTISGTENDPEFYTHGRADLSKLPVKQEDEISESGNVLKTPYPYFYINEIRTNFQGVKDLPLSEIALIRYIPPPANMAPMNGGWIGVIAIYTKKWDEGMIAGKTIDETFGRNMFHGYSIAREFQEPDYSINDSLASQPDSRTTLYWNPDLVPDSIGRIHFTFYNSDHAKKYRVVIEGMDSRGRLAHIDSLIDYL
jgi:hypothetical protein